MTNNTGLGFFKDSESFLTELSDLESEYLRGGKRCGSKTTSKTTCKTSKTY